MRRKQQLNESVDEFAHDLGKLFEHSYGRRKGMDGRRKEMLKRDFFLQGLWLKCQEKVLPSAKTFHALHQACAGKAALEFPLLRVGYKVELQCETHAWPVQGHRRLQSHFRESLGWLSLILHQERVKCLGYAMSAVSLVTIGCDCPEHKPPSETPRKVRASQRATSSAVLVAHSHETLEDRCQRLKQEWVGAEFLLLSQCYEGKASVDKVAVAVCPLYYYTVNIAGEHVKAMVDTGSSATILSWDVFQAIGRKAQVSASALYKPDVTLRDYSQRPNLVGAMVDLEVEFCGKSVVVLIYLRAARHADQNPVCWGQMLLVLWV